MAAEQEHQVTKSNVRQRVNDESTALMNTASIPRAGAEASIQLSPAELKEAKKLSQQIPVPHRLELLSYGKNVGERLSGSLAPLLSDIRNQDTGEIGELLKKLQRELEELQPSSLTSATVSSSKKLIGMIPFIGQRIINYTYDVQAYFRRFQRSSEQIRSITEGLEEQSINQRESYGRLEAHKRSMLDDLIELRIMIGAGELRIKKENDLIVKEGETLKGKDVFTEEALKLTEHRQQVDALERRVDDLRRAYVTTLTGITSIAMSQESALSLVENIESSVPHQIRLFVQMVIQAKASYDQAKTVAYVQATRDTTNNMMKSAGEMFRKAQLGTKELEGEGFVSTEAIKQYSDAIIATAKQLVEKDKKNRTKREEAAALLANVEKDIKKMLIDVQVEKVREASGTNRLLGTMTGNNPVH